MRISEVLGKCSSSNRKENGVWRNSRILEDWKVKSYGGHVKMNTNFSGRSVGICEELLFRISQRNIRC